MAWYDVFSGFYDRSLEKQYAEARAVALEAMHSREGLVVLDVPTGTGQSLDGLAAAVGASGRVLGVDLSEGMLRKADARIERRGLSNARTHRGSVLELRQDELAPLVDQRAIDRVHAFLGLTVFPEWERAFELLWDLLAPGGRMVIVDVYAERPGLQGKMVQWMAQADLTRRTWAPLEARGQGFERTTVSTKWVYGGELFCAAADKPGAAA